MNNYLHDGGRAGGSLPQQEVDVEGLEELLVVLGADTLILTNDRHLPGRISEKIANVLRTKSDKR